jgi:hypothetical protein
MAERQQGQRTLDDAARRRAFRIAAPILVVGVVGLMLLPGDGPDTASHRARSGDQRRVIAQPTALATPSRSATPAPQPMLELDDRDRSAIVARSRLFLTALLRYERGTITPDVRQALRRTATPRLATELLERPPRHPPGLDDQTGRIAGLEPTDDPDSPVVAVSATIERGRRLTPLTVVLERGRGSWLVSDTR